MPDAIQSPADNGPAIERGPRQLLSSSNQCLADVAALSAAAAQLGEVALDPCEIRHRPQLQCGLPAEALRRGSFDRVEEIEVSINPRRWVLVQEPLHAL